MSKKKTAGPKGLDAYAKKVEPIIAEAQSTRGFVAEVTRQLGRILGRPDLKRQSVDPYLNPDRDKRVEPSFSMAMALFKAVEQAREKLKGAT